VDDAAPAFGDGDDQHGLAVAFELVDLAEDERLVDARKARDHDRDGRADARLGRRRRLGLRRYLHVE
jgi:hypothetical protein